MAREKGDSRIGFGQFAGTAGAAVVAIAVSQPWLTLNAQKAFSQALQTGKLPPRIANEILFALSNGPGRPPLGAPRSPRLLSDIGIEQTGWAQQQDVAIVLLVAAAVAAFGIVRSIAADTAFGARRNARWLALAGIASLIAAAVELWVLAPKPRAAMRPDTGLWMVAAGGILLLLGALTLGNNRRRPFLDDLDSGQPMKAFDNTEHLAYSHGAWVPRVPDDRR